MTFRFQPSNLTAMWKSSIGAGPAGGELTQDAATATVCPCGSGVSGQVRASPSAATTTPSSGRERRLGRGRRADARGRRHPRHRSASSRGRCSSRRRAATSSAGWTGSWTCSHANGDRGRPGHRHRLPAAVVLARLHPETLPVSAPTARGCGRAAGRPAARARRSTASTPLALVEQARRALRRAPGARDVARRQRVRLPQRAAATATPARRRSGSGCSARYGDLDALNARLGHGVLEPALRRRASEIVPPRTAPTFANPAQQLDFRRFSSDALLGQLPRRARRAAPGHPGRSGHHELHGHRPLPRPRLRRLGPSTSTCCRNDHYLVGALTDPRGRAGLRRRPDTRASPAGDPWLLMEHSTSAVNWQPRNLRQAARADDAPQPRRTSPAAPTPSCSSSGGPSARRRARSSTPALVPHAGTDTTVWREVVELGAVAGRLAEVRGSRVDAEVALLWDHERWLGLRARTPTRAPSVALPGAVAGACTRRCGAGRHRRLRAPRGATCPATALVLVPSLYLVSDAAAAAVARLPPRRAGTWW